MGIGGGKSSGSTSVQMTPEQQRALAIQTDALEKTFLPAYQSTVTGAKDIMNQTMGGSLSAAQNASNVAGQAGALQQGAGSNAYLSGLGGQQGLAGYQQNLGQNLTGYGSGQLAQLFSPAYKQEQIQASLQPAREAIREQMGSQNAMYGGAGGLGSSRMALADKNLAQLGQQRLQSAAAQTSAAVEGQRQAAAQSLLGAGQTATGQAGNLYGSLTGAGQAGLSGAQQAAASQIGYAGIPQDIYAKYAQVVYGTPQASTTPNFAGTQGSTSSSSGVGASFGKGSDISIKENIRKIGVLDNGINLYKFEYKEQYKDVWGHGDQIGVMAQEVEKIIPEAVGIHEDGYKIVNYSMVM